MTVERTRCCQHDSVSAQTLGEPARMGATIWFIVFWKEISGPVSMMTYDLLLFYLGEKRHNLVYLDLLRY